MSKSRFISTPLFKTALIKTTWGPLFLLLFFFSPFTSFSFIVKSPSTYLCPYTRAGHSRSPVVPCPSHWPPSPAPGRTLIGQFPAGRRAGRDTWSSRGNMRPPVGPPRPCRWDMGATVPSGTAPSHRAGPARSRVVLQQGEIWLGFTTSFKVMIGNLKGKTFMAITSQCVTLEHGLGLVLVVGSAFCVYVMEQIWYAIRIQYVMDESILDWASIQLLFFNIDYQILVRPRGLPFSMYAPRGGSSLLYIWGPWRGGGGVLILHVEFKKAQCRPVEFKKCSCRPVEFKKCSCRTVEFKKCSCPMSLRPKIPCVALSILGV